MREKISPAIKQKVVTGIESGRLSQSEAARRLGINKETIRSWLSAYRSEGSIGLESDSKNRIYSVQIKLQAVEAYLTGKCSQQRICEIFKAAPHNRAFLKTEKRPTTKGQTHSKICLRGKPQLSR